MGRPQRLGAPGRRVVAGPPAAGGVLDEAADQRRQEHRVGRVGADVEDPDLDRGLAGGEPGVEVEHPRVAGRAEVQQLPAQLPVGGQRVKASVGPALGQRDQSWERQEA